MFSTSFGKMTTRKGIFECSDLIGQSWLLFNGNSKIEGAAMNDIDKYQLVFMATNAAECFYGDA